MRSILYAFIFLTPIVGLAQEILPKEIPWKGKTEKLIRKANDPWVTPSETTNIKDTPNYDETTEWLRKLVESSPLLSMQSIGKTAQGRDIWLIIAAKNPDFQPNANTDSNKAVILAQAGIHAGEIDGKDAGMMLLRDMAHGKKEKLLEKVNFLFIPILNADGHERRSSYNRPNQRGPENMGWRTNSLNQNLNRDYTKVETLELQAVLKVINRYDPDLYIDLHVTDGADYQYDITYGYIGEHGYSPSVSRWFAETYETQVNKRMEKQGHVPGPLLFARNGRTFSGGNMEYTFAPSYSHAYGDLRHLPTILVENHSLKNYRRRVLGTYSFLESTMETVGGNIQSLRASVKQDRSQQGSSMVVSWTFPRNENGMIPYDSIRFKGIKYKTIESEITQNDFIEWLGEPTEFTIPVFRNNKPVSQVEIPSYYIIPAERMSIIEKLKLHGIEMEPLTSDTEYTSRSYQLSNHRYSSRPSEGRVRVYSDKTVVSKKVTFQKGDWKVLTNQPLKELVVMLLEPDAPQSLYQWGYFLDLHSRTEYIEGYAIEPLAIEMLKEDAIKSEFEAWKKENPEALENSRAVYQWFYSRSPYYDNRFNVYPIGRIFE